MKKVYDYENSRHNIRIPGNEYIPWLDRYSDLELAARFCDNKVNFAIFKNLLKKNSKNTVLINKTVKAVVLCQYSKPCIKAIKLLIDYGADINFFDDDATPLMVICEYNEREDKIEIIEFLLKNGCDVNIKRKDGCSAFMLLCIKAQSYNIKAIKLFLEYNANINICDRLSWSCLMHIADKSHYDIAKLLIEKGADVNHITCSGNNILNFMCYYPTQENNKIIKLLIENGANVNTKNNTGKTPLMKLIKYCTSDHDFEIIKLLISKGDKVNCQDIHGKTLLMICYKRPISELFKYSIIKLLLDNKVDIYVKNANSENILDIIKKHKTCDIYSLIFNYKNIHNDHLCEFDIGFIYNLSSC